MTSIDEDTLCVCNPIGPDPAPFDNIRRYTPLPRDKCYQDMVGEHMNGRGRLLVGQFLPGNEST